MLRLKVRDRDISHFTSHVLQRYTRVKYYILEQISSQYMQDMAWGTKTIRFESGGSVKIGNVVLEAMKSAIIRDYMKSTRLHNANCDPEEKIQLFTARTYYKWLQVFFIIYIILILTFNPRL